MDGGVGKKEGTEESRLKMKEIKLKSASKRSSVLQTGKRRGDFGLQERQGGGGGESKHSKLKEHSSQREGALEKREPFQR